MLAALSLPLLLAPGLLPVLVGLTLFAVGTFAAQAIATGFVGKTASPDPGAASGLYLACYFLGGLAGSAALGAVYVHLGWTGCIAGIAATLALAVLLAWRLTEQGASTNWVRASCEPGSTRP
jgi:predicted MFS family arabinose efflux permease